MTNKPTTWVIVPTYNEADNIDNLIQQLLMQPVNLGIIVVDDGSPDGTGELVDAWVAELPERVHAVHREGKLGLGTAYIAGFQVALHEKAAQKIMTMDADFSHNPRYVPSMIELSKQKHVVIGSRYTTGGGTLNWPASRVALSAVSNVVARTLLGLQASDTTAGFRLYDRAVLESLPLDSVISSGYSFLVEMLFMVQRRGWQIGEVPILFEDRREGTTKIARGEIFRGMYTVFRLFARRLRGGEPVQPAIQPAE